MACWVRSSFCGGGGCVEAALLPDGSIGVRDSKDDGGPVLRFSAAEWDAFLAGVRGGEFDTGRQRKPDDGLCNCPSGSSSGYGGWHPWREGRCSLGRPVERGPMVPVTPHYSAALDEIWRLRTQLAAEAATLRDAATHARATSRRYLYSAAADRMERAAQGEPVWPSEYVSDRVRIARAEALGIRPTLPRSAWEDQTFGTTEET